MSETLAALKARYEQTRETSSHRELAELELLIWQTWVQQAPAAETTHRHRAFLMKSMGCTEATWHAHQLLRRLGDNPVADLIWQKLDDKLMSITDAQAILRRAESERRKSGGSIDDHLLDLLSAHEKGTFNQRERYTTRQVRKRRASAVRRNGSVVKRPSRQPNPPPPPERYTLAHFKREMGELTTKYLTEWTSEVATEEEKLRLRSEFLDVMALAVQDLRRGVERLRTASNSAANAKLPRIGRQSFAQACEVLAFDWRFGKPIDLTMVKKRKYARIRELHPDQNGGDRSHEAELQAVLWAVEVFEAYHHQQTQNKEASHE